MLARGQLVQEIVGELSEKQRACYVLFEAHGFTAQEIGELEGLPVGTVFSCLRLARAHIEEKNELLAARDRSVKVLRQKRKVAS